MTGKNRRSLGRRADRCRYLCELSLRGADDNLYLMTIGHCRYRGIRPDYFGGRRVVLPPQPTYLYRHTPEGKHRRSCWNVWIWNIRSKTAASSVLSGRCGKTEMLRLSGAATPILYCMTGRQEKKNIRCRATEILTNNDGMIAVRENTIVTLGQDQEKSVELRCADRKAVRGKQRGGAGERNRFSDNR